MAEERTEKLFSIPAENLKELDRGMQRLKQLKKLAADLKDLGQNTSQMDADIKRLEQMNAVIRRYAAEAKVIPEKLTKSTMGLFADWIAFYSKIARAVISGIGDKVEEIGNEIDIAVLKARDQIAELMEFDLFFIGYCIWSIEAVVLTVGVSLAVQTWYATSAISGRLEAFFDTLSSSDLALRFEQLRIISQIAQIIFPAYRDIVKDVYKALGGISKVIYKATNDMATWFLAGRHVVYSALIVAGYDPDSAELKAYAESEPWIVKVRDRYRRYVEDPYQIMADIEDEIIKPILTDLSEENRQTLAKINDAYLDAAQALANVQQLNTSVQSWIDTLPDEIGDKIEGRIGYVLDAIDEGLARFERDVLDPIGQSLSIINTAVAKSDARIAELESKYFTPIEVFYEFFSLDPSARADVLGILRKLINQDRDYAQAIVSQSIAQDFASYKIKTRMRLQEPMALITEPEPLPSITVTLPKIQYPKGSWFVGEY